MTPLCPLMTMPGIPRDPRLGLWGEGARNANPLPETERNDYQLERLVSTCCAARGKVGGAKPAG